MSTSTLSTGTHADSARQVLSLAWTGRRANPTDLPVSVFPVLTIPTYATKWAFYTGQSKLVHASEANTKLPSPDLLKGVTKQQTQKDNELTSKVSTVRSDSHR